MGNQGKAGDLLKKTMATAAVKTANDKAQALCAKVDAGTNTAADLDTIRTEKKVVYDVSNRKNNALGGKVIIMVHQHIFFSIDILTAILLSFTIFSPFKKISNLACQRSC